MPHMMQHRKQITLEAANQFIKAQQQTYPSGPAWGTATPDIVRAEVQSLADSNGSICLHRYASLLLRMHSGRKPGDANRALQSLIMEASRFCQDGRTAA